MARPKANDLKLKKQKRMRRAYLKGYDMGTMIRVQRRVGTGDIPENHLGYFNYRARGNSYWDEYLEAKFPSRGMESVERQEALRKSRLDCVNQLNDLTKEVIPEMNVVLQRGGITKTIIRFYFSSDYSHCFFMKEDWADMAMYKSGVYGSKERAMFNYKNKSINWLTRIALPRIEQQPD